MQQQPSADDLITRWPEGGTAPSEHLTFGCGTVGQYLQQRNGPGSLLHARQGNWPWHVLSGSPLLPR
jgi:hypothetical protein